MARPSFGFGQVQRAEQQMLLQPRMLQSIEVLAVPSAELESYLAAAAQENEALVVRPARGPGGGWDATERHDEMLRNQASDEHSLAEVLEREIAMLDLDDEQEAWVRLCVRSLDDDGYLSISDDELLDAAEADGLPRDPGALGRAIAAVQRMEPRGVGGRDMVEALLLQLDPASDEYELLCRLIEEFLDDLVKNRLPKVAKDMGVELAQLRELMAGLRGLEPKPGASLVERRTEAVRPEVVVERVGDGYEVRVEHANFPGVEIDAEVEAASREKGGDAQWKACLRERVERARWLVDAVEGRKATLLRVARVVFERQRAFLDEGPGHRVPLAMGDVAEILNLHVSTVSRAVSGKSVQTPWGIEPLRDFFQTGVGESDGTARDELREVVRALFEGEDKSAPFSDDEAVNELERKGHRLARRTVAKYRKELGIPSSYRRRHHA